MLVAYPRLKGYLESEIESGPCNFEKGNTHNSVVSPRPLNYCLKRRFHFLNTHRHQYIVWSQAGESDRSIQLCPKRSSQGACLHSSSSFGCMLFSLFWSLLQSPFAIFFSIRQMIHPSFLFFCIWVMKKHIFLFACFIRFLIRTDLIGFESLQKNSVQKCSSFFFFWTKVLYVL